MLHDIFCPLWTCLKRKQKKWSYHREQRGSLDSLEDDIDSANKRSSNLANLRDLEPEYISNMTIHSWKEEEDHKALRQILVNFTVTPLKVFPTTPPIAPSPHPFPLINNDRSLSIIFAW